MSPEERLSLSSKEAGSPVPLIWVPFMVPVEKSVSMVCFHPERPETKDKGDSIRHARKKVTMTLELSCDIRGPTV